MLLVCYCMRKRKERGILEVCTSANSARGLFCIAKWIMAQTKELNLQISNSYLMSTLNPNQSLCLETKFLDQKHEHSINEARTIYRIYIYIYIRLIF